MELFIDDNQLVFENGPNDKWTVEIGKIKLIGEYTTAAGPWLDDYFFVFAKKEDDWYEAPNEAVKDTRFWQQLSGKLDCEIRPSLANSIQWASRVLFPKELKGQVLFHVIKEEQPGSTLWQKVFRTTNTSETLTLTGNVKKLFS